MYRKKKVIGYAVFVLFLLLLQIFLLYLEHLEQEKDAVRDASRSFTKLTETILANELSEDSLSLHYTIADPVWLPADAAISLPVFTPQSPDLAREKITGYLADLTDIDFTQLDPCNAKPYELLEDYLIDELTSLNYYYLQEPLAPGSGVQTQLPVLLAEYSFATEKDVTDYLALLQKRFTADYSELSKITASIETPEELDALLELPEAPIDSPEEMLEDLESRILVLFPSLPQSIDYTVKEVEEAMSEYSAPAFYLTPPIDALTDNVIYINKPEQQDFLTLYTTLAHEGFPGHLYQTVYSWSYADSIDENPIRALLYYGGYTEGWALYTENLAYEYAADLLADDVYCRLNQLNRNLQLNLFSILDLSIHYYDISYEESAALLSAYGINDPGTIEEIYYYIVDEPVNYLKYYIGYLEMLECRALAQEIWLEEYSDYRFHQYVLEYGPADFESIKEGIREGN